MNIGRNVSNLLKGFWFSVKSKSDIPDINRINPREYGIAFGTLFCFVMRWAAIASIFWFILWLVLSHGDMVAEWVFQ